MTTERGYLGKGYGALAPGDGIYGDAIIDDAAHKAPRAVIPIAGGRGIVIGGDTDIEIAAAVPSLRAFEGLLRVGGSGTNFGYEFYAPKQGSLTGGYALIEDRAIQIAEMEYNTETRDFKIGMVTSAAAVAPDPAKFTGEEFKCVDTAGSVRTFKFDAATAEATTYEGNSAYKWEWTVPSDEAHLWTAAAAATSAGTSWSISAPITVLNYVPHATGRQSGDFLQTQQGEPLWDAIRQQHLPDNLVDRQGQLLAHMGEGAGFKRLGYLMAGQGASVAAVFPPADYDAPAVAYVESEDGSTWDYAILLPDETTEVVYANRSRVLVTTQVHAAAGAIDYDGRVDGDDNYRDAMRSFTLTSLVDAGDDGNGYTDLRISIDIGEIADLTTAPSALYVRITGDNAVRTLPRLTGELANAQGSDGHDYPQYGIQFVHGEDTSDSMAWYLRGQAILRGVPANSNQLEIQFYTNAAGSQALNIKPVRGRSSGTKAWQSVKPPALPSWVTDPDEEIPTRKVRYVGITALADNAVGPGIAVTSLTGNHASAFQLLSPIFDLDDEDNQAGLLEFEIRRTMTNPSPANLGYGSGNDATATIFARVRVRDLRNSTAYSATQENGVLIGKTDVMAGSAKVGEERTYLAKNAANQVGIYTRYAFESGHSTAGSYNGGLRVDGDFLHNEAPPQTAAVAPRADEISVRYPATGSASVTLTTAAATAGLFTMEILGTVKSISGATFMGVSTDGAGTDYFTLPAGFYAIDVHSQFTNGATGGGSRATPEVYLERSSDGGSVWTEIPESRQGGYKKAGGGSTYQSRDTIHFTSTCHLAAAADERFRVRYSRYYQAEASTQSENIEGQVTAVKFS